MKDESAQPTGTWKDRRSALIVRQAMEDGTKNLVLISAGNAALSLANAASGSVINVYAIVDKRTPQPIVTHLQNVCAGVITAHLNKAYLSEEDQLNLVRTAIGKELSNAKCVSDGFEAAYIPLVRELAADLQKMPDTIMLPTGSRESLIGIYEGLQEIGWDRTTVVGVTSDSNLMLHTHFVPRAYEKQLATLNESGRLKIVTSHVSDEEALTFVPEGVSAEAAAAHAFAWLYDTLPIDPELIGQNVVIINSGMGQFHLQR
jgi:threonine synthase